MISSQNGLTHFDNQCDVPLQSDSPVGRRRCVGVHWHSSMWHRVCSSSYSFVQYQTACSLACTGLFSPTPRLFISSTQPWTAELWRWWVNISLSVASKCNLLFSPLSPVLLSVFCFPDDDVLGEIHVRLMMYVDFACFLLPPRAACVVVSSRSCSFLISSSTLGRRGLLGLKVINVIRHLKASFRITSMRNFLAR